MASNKLTEGERKSILESAHKTLQRPRNFVKFPLSDAEIVAIHDSCFTPKTVQAYTWLRANGHLNANAFSNLATLDVRGVGRKTLTIIARTGHAVLFNTRDSGKGPEAKQPLTLARVEQAIGADRVRALVDWAHTRTQAIAAAEQSLRVLEDLLKIPSTIGHLARMVPDLMPLVSGEKLSSIAEQAKTSPLPKEWAATPREPITEMLDYLTKCNLMPPVEFHNPGCDILGSQMWIDPICQWSE